MREIDQRLNAFSSKIIEHSVLETILKDWGYKNPNDKITRLRKQGILTPLKRGYYLYNSLASPMFSKEIMANLLLGPSYISLDYALYFYGLIPESIHTLTSITTKRSKAFQTCYGIFDYKHLKQSLFGFGLEIHSSSFGNFLMASREKALCDKVFLTRGVDLRSKASMIEFLEEDLRIDLDELSNMKIEIFEEFLQKSKSKKIEILKNLIKELKRD